MRVFGNPLRLPSLSRPLIDEKANPVGRRDRHDRPDRRAHRTSGFGQRAKAPLLLGTSLAAGTVALGGWLLRTQGAGGSRELGGALISGGIVAIAITAGETLRDIHLARDSDRRSLLQTLELPGSLLDGAPLSDKDLRGVSLSRRSLVDCRLSHSKLDYADLGTPI